MPSDLLVADYSAKGIPVIDLINGINSDKISARVAADFYDMGLATGKYLVGLRAGDTKPVKVGWFPGPAGAACFRSAADRSSAARGTHRCTIASRVARSVGLDK